MKKKCTICDKEYEGSYMSLMCNDCYNEIQIEKYESAKIPDRDSVPVDVKVIDHPQRYGGDTTYECIKVLQNWMSEDEYKGFLRGNTLKYLCRVGKKDEVVQELKKAAWYLNKLIEFEENKNA